MSERVTIVEAANLIGYPRRCLLRRFIREGLLPYPDQETMTWLRSDVLALRDWMLAKSKGDTSVPRPQHRNF